MKGATLATAAGVRRRPGRLALALVLCAAGLGTVAWMLHRGWAELQGLELSLSFPTVLLSVALHAVVIAVGAVGWTSLMGQFGSIESSRTHAWIVCVSGLAAKVPVPLAHVVGRVALYSQPGDRRAVPLAAGLELLYCALSGLILALAFSADPAGDLTWLRLVGAGVLAGVAVHPAAASWLAVRLKLTTAPLRFRNTLSWLGLYLVLQVAIAFFLFSTIQWIHPLPGAALPQVLAISGAVTVARVLAILLPHSFGVAEGSLSVLLATLMPGGLAALVAVLYALLFAVLDALLGGLALAIGKGAGLPEAQSGL